MPTPKTPLSAYELYNMFVDYFSERQPIDPDNSIYSSDPRSDERTATLLIPQEGNSPLQIAFHVRNDQKTAFFEIRTPELTEKFIIKNAIDFGRWSLTYDDQSMNVIIKTLLYGILDKHSSSCSVYLRAEKPKWDDAYKHWIYLIFFDSPKSCSQEEFKGSLDTVNEAVEAVSILWKEAMRCFPAFETTRKREVKSFIDAMKDIDDPIIKRLSGR